MMRRRSKMNLPQQDSSRYLLDQEEEKVSHLESDGEGVDEEEKIAADHDFNDVARQNMTELRGQL